ncbi:hypothetical protein [Acetobacter estunensis]|uniref:hypothetical protein n=1 Tax=Acetobacter estunensis TaxID=104097 RepID=UPI001C2DD3EE|nr:hypothetical protein [Acetobacter estunensis]MBV1835633.1 hypothetical protein [Acetobacter estunensis]MBV1836106.1 hypothetical protein [Acetobacter estunensis]
MLGISPKNVGISPKTPVQTMSGSTLTDQFQDMVREEVAERRASGLKGAFREVARIFGLTERRVRAAWNRELRSVRAEEWEAVRTRRLASLRARQEHIAAELAALEEEFATHDAGFR